jgi:hypothetical protein
MFAMCMVYGLQQIRRARDGSMESLSRSAPKSAYFVRGSFRRAGGRKRIEENKYEKSVDNRSAALVSRIPGVRNERLETRKTHCLRPD